MQWVCVPLIVIGLIGLLWSLPVPKTFSQSSPALNWGTLFLMAAVAYYFIMSIRLAFGILPFVVFVGACVAWLDGLAPPLWLTSGCLLAVASAGQLVGGLLDGERPSVLRGFQFTMIGPLWLLASVYRRLGIRY